MNTLHRSVSNHFFILITIAYGTGIVSTKWLIPDAQYLYLPVLLFSFLSIIGHMARRFHLTRLLLLCLFFVLGLLNTCLENAEPNDPDHILNQITGETEVVLIGTLLEMPEFDNEQSKIKIKIKSLQFKDDSRFIKSKGIINLSLREPWPTQFKAGDLLAVRTLLGKPHGFRNPGVFYYPRYLAMSDIWVTGKIRSRLHVAKVNVPFSLFDKLYYLPEQMRTTISRILDQSLSLQHAALYKAILIGDRSSVDKNTLELFKTTGCMHILAISGLHMGIISGFLFFIVHWLLRQSEWVILHFPVKKTAAMLCLPPIFLYTFIAGSNTPVVRSFIMSAIVIVALCTNRRKSAFPLLSLAALIILIMDPRSLFSASFQLSFAAVTAICITIPFVSQNLSQKTSQNNHKILIRRLSIWLISAFIISVSATIGTLPILLYHFNRISTIGPLANIIIEPLICLWGLLLGFIAIPFIWISPPMASLIFKLGSFCFYPAVYILKIFSNLPYASVYLPTPSRSLLLIYILSFSLLFYSGKTRFRLFGVAGLVTTIFFLFNAPINLFANSSNKSIITFLDVGHGSSTLIQMPNGKNILIDGGATTTLQFNIGEHVIAPFLWHKGIKRLEAVILTHPDSDHYNGLDFVVKHFTPNIIWTSTIDGKSDGYSSFLSMARRLGIRVEIPRENQIIIREGNIDITCLSRPGEMGKPSNDQGLILRYRHNQFTSLFPGDISSSAEKKLVSQAKPIQSDILLASHHGSATSNSNLFLETVKPDMLVVSNSRQHPSPPQMTSLAQRCRQKEIRVRTTNSYGAITVKSDGTMFNQTSVKSLGGF